MLNQRPYFGIEGYIVRDGLCSISYNFNISTYNYISSSYRLPGAPSASRFNASAHIGFSHALQASPSRDTATAPSA